MNTTTAAHTLTIIDHSDNTGCDEIFASLTEANASLEAFAQSEDLMAAETTDGGYALLDEAGHHTHTAYIAA